MLFILFKNQFCDCIKIINKNLFLNGKLLVCFFFSLFAFNFLLIDLINIFFYLLPSLKEGHKKKSKDIYMKIYKTEKLGEIQKKSY